MIAQGFFEGRSHLEGHSISICTAKVLLGGTLAFFCFYYFPKFIPVTIPHQ